MSLDKQHIFRTKALKHYLQGREADVLPHLLPPRTFVFLWVAFALLIIIGFSFTTWNAEVLTSANGLGIVTYTSGVSPKQKPTVETALVFLSSDREETVKAGQVVSLQLVGTLERYTSIVGAVDPTVRTVDELRQRYALDNKSTNLIPLPTVVVHTHFRTYQTYPLYTGSILTATIQTGSQSILSLLLKQV